MNKVMDLSFWQLLSAYVFIVLLLLIVRWRKIPRERQILIATIRMTLQLVLVGYILMYVFEHAHPLYTISSIGLMQLFAIYNVFQKAETTLPSALKRVIAFSMTIGILGSLLYFIFVVIQLTPWYEPRYFIPIAGMIIGNSMTGITLGVNQLMIGMRTQKDEVEGALMLGATPQRAAKVVTNQAFDAAMLPTINSVVGMGIVFLPGMMTGQILSGTSPVVAIEYQIAVMLGIVGSVSLTVILFLQLGYKSFFNERSQLVDIEYEKKGNP